MTSSAMKRVAAELGVATPQAFQVIAEGEAMTAYEDAHPEIDSPKHRPPRIDPPKAKRPYKRSRRRRSSPQKRRMKQE